MTSLLYFRFRFRPRVKFSRFKILDKLSQNLSKLKKFKV